MSISEETLAAYVDGELDAAARAGIEAAIGEDPSIEQRIARYRALRARIQAAYAAELEEPVPDRLMAALRGPGPGASPVSDLEAARAAKARRSAPAIAVRARWRYSLAASVLIAAGAGFLAWRHTHIPAIENARGTWVARGALAEGLSEQLAGDTSASGVRIGLSFLAKSGDYCRTFSLSEDAGLACRRDGRWEILTLAKESRAQAPAPRTGSQFRTASSPMPAIILQAVERQISGEPLDHAGEIAARGRNWTDAKSR